MKYTKNINENYFDVLAAKYGDKPQTPNPKPQTPRYYLNSIDFNKYITFKLVSSFPSFVYQRVG